MVTTVKSVRSERIEKLIEGVNPKIFPLCVERDRFYTEGQKEADRDGDSRILRVARGFVSQLDKVTIFIEDGELIVGNLQSKPGGLELSGPWSREELKDLAQECGCTYSEEGAEEI